MFLLVPSLPPVPLLRFSIPFRSLQPSKQKNVRSLNLKQSLSDGTWSGCSGPPRSGSRCCPVPCPLGTEQPRFCFARPILAIWGDIVTPPSHVPPQLRLFGLWDDVWGGPLCPPCSPNSTRICCCCCGVLGTLLLGGCSGGPGAQPPSLRLCETSSGAGDRPGCPSPPAAPSQGAATRIWHPSHPAPLVGPQRQRLLVPPLPRGHVMDQNL